MTIEARTVTVSCPVDAPAVYAYACEPAHLPKWASGLSSGIRQRDGRWFARSPMGEVEVAMAPRNDLGVMDHDVTLPDGRCVHNAFRVTPAGEGSVLTFVVLRMPGTTDAAFEADVMHVRSDLQKLCRLLDEGAGG